MKRTSYERTFEYLRSGMAAARQAVRGLPASMIVPCLFDAVRRPLTPEELNSNGLTVTLPFALAERATTEVPDPFVWEDFGSSAPMTALADFELEVMRIVYASDPNADPHQNDSWVSANLIHLWQYQCHRLAGERVYELSRGLTERLLHTELRGLDTNDLRLPYRNIYIVIPPDSGLSLVNERTGTHVLEGIYVTEYERNGVRVWRLLFWGPPNEKATHDHDDSLFHFTVELPADTTLDEALDRSELDRHTVTTAVARQYYSEQWRRLFALVMNTVVYVTWPDAELREVQSGEFTKLQEQLKKHPKGSHKYERTREKLKNTLPQRRVQLGASVPLLHDTGGSTGPLAVRTLVAGHWKRQPYGEGRALRKWIHIAPFWRGPEGAPESNPRRVLE